MQIKKESKINKYENQPVNWTQANRQNATQQEQTAEHKKIIINFFFQPN